jgi:fatty-acyl-CoA synthase
MAPTAFIRRPQRWIQALSAGSQQGGVVTAAPNFGYEWTAQRGRPADGDDIDLHNVSMIIGSEPVGIAAIDMFNEAFAPFGLPPTAFKPSYGMPEDHQRGMPEDHQRQTGPKSLPGAVPRGTLGGHGAIRR